MERWWFLSKKTSLEVSPWGRFCPVGLYFFGKFTSLGQNKSCHNVAIACRFVACAEFFEKKGFCGKNKSLKIAIPTDHEVGTVIFSITSWDTSRELPEVLLSSKKDHGSFNNV